jgi:hypothetical protein
VRRDFESKNRRNEEVKKLCHLSEVPAGGRRGENENDKTKATCENQVNNGIGE